MTKKKSNAGRKKIILDEKDWKIIDTAILFGTKQYCAEKVNISIDTLTRAIKEKYNCEFSVYKEQKREEIKVNLQLKQYDIAMKGNVSMLIWLGKVWLGQKEIEIENLLKPLTIEIIETNKRPV